MRQDAHLRLRQVDDIYISALRNDAGLRPQRRVAGGAPDAYTACAVGRAKPREGLTELQDRKSRMTQTVQKETDRIMNTVVLRVVNRL